jgi:calcyphosin
MGPRPHTKLILPPQSFSHFHPTTFIYIYTQSHGARGIAGLGRKFRICDDDHSGKIEYKEFVKAISEHALGWTDKQIRCVFEFFDSDKSGSIDFDEFIFGVRGQLNERRTQIVLQAFEVRKSWIE